MTRDWLTATEFEDQAQVARAKMAQLATLMRLSKRTVVYSGAGISASAVGQAALSGTNKVGWTGNKTSAIPTPTHHALARLGQAGWIHGWVVPPQRPERSFSCALNDQRLSLAVAESKPRRPPAKGGLPAGAHLRSAWLVV